MSKTLTTLAFITILSTAYAGTVEEMVFTMPPIKTLECGIERVVPKESFHHYSMSQNGLESYWFDTNKDGLYDVEIMASQGDENRFPVFYTFDRDYDRQPDITYVDKLRDGTCNGIEVYWLKGQEEKEESNKHDGEPVDCITQDCDNRKEGVL